MEQFLETALTAARSAAGMALAYYRGDFEVEIKDDLTPVTVRGTLLEAFPDHGFFGEESGKEQENAEYLWLVDPIDGTKSFVGGYGMWSTQIALMHRGELVLGVSSAPAARELAWAAKGMGAFLDGEPIRVSGKTDLGQAAGQLDAVIESDVNILDIAALSVIVREAGGVFTDLSGRSPDLATTTVLAATPGLHGRLLEMLGP